MKYGIILICFFSLFLISCKTRCDRSFKTADRRCLDLKREATKKGKKAGICYDGPLTIGLDKEAKHPDPEACSDLYKDAQKQCDALPPDPDSTMYLSGSSFYKGLPDCDECKDCEPIE